MPQDPSPTIRRRRLGAELRAFREAAGRTLEDAGQELECHFTKISRLENGRSTVRRRDLDGLLDFYEVADTRKRESLHALSRDGGKQGWWHTYEDVLSPPYMDFISLETEARSLNIFQSQLVPGLLQTLVYARAVVAADPSWGGADAVERFAQVRIERQGVLTRERPLELWVVLGEGVLRQQVGGPAVMREQLEHLERTSSLPNVTVQVLPFTAGAHAGMQGSFTVLEFAERFELTVVAVENLTASLYLETPAEIDRHRLVFDHLRAAALSPAESVARIEDIARELT
jgi:transcriptional regulator with XRE-family HTH domain